MRPWSVRIILPTPTGPSVRLEPAEHFVGVREIDGEPVTARELRLLLHSGGGHIYPLGEGNPASEIWYGGYLPAGQEPSIVRAVDIEAGGDFEQLSDVVVAVADQMDHGQKLSVWIETALGVKRFNGAGIYIYDTAPSPENPYPSPRWTGEVRGSTLVSGNIILQCESLRLANEIGSDLGGGVLRTIVYGAPHRVKLLPHGETDQYPQVIEGVIPANCGITLTRTFFVYNYHKDELGQNWIFFLANTPEWVELELGSLTITTSDWWLEAVHGGGAGEIRRLTKGATVFYGDKLYWTTGGGGDGWWFPIDDAFEDPDTRALLVGYGAYVRLVRKSLEFALPAHIETSADLVTNAIATYLRVDGEFVSASQGDEIWEAGEQPFTARAISHYSRPGFWVVYAHIMPGSQYNQYDLVMRPQLDSLVEPALSAAKIQYINALNDDEGVMYPMLASYLSYIVQMSIGFDDIPRVGDVDRIWPIVAMLLDAKSMVILQARNRGSGEVLLRAEGDLARIGNYVGIGPSDFSPWSTPKNWRHNTPHLYAIQSKLKACDFLALTVTLSGNPYPSFWEIGQLSLVAEYQYKIADVYIDCIGPGPATGDLAVQWTARLSGLSSSAFPAGTEAISDHAHLLEDMAYRYRDAMPDHQAFIPDSGNPLLLANASSIEGAYFDREAKTRATGTPAPLQSRAKASLALDKSHARGDVYAQICRDGMFVGGLDGGAAVTLKAFLARTGLAEYDAEILPTDYGSDSFDGFDATSLANLVTAPLIRFAVIDGTPTKALQILSPDASSFDPSYAVGFDQPADAERAWGICHDAWRKCGLIQAREMIFETVSDYSSLITLIMQERGVTFLEWIGSIKDLARPTIDSDHPAASLPLGSRIRLVHPEHCPSGRYGTLHRIETKLGAGKATTYIMMDPL